MALACDMLRAAGIETIWGDTRVRDFCGSEEERACTEGSGVPCDECGLELPFGYRPDPCIGGYLPDVIHACCGHGDVGDAYVTIAPGERPDRCASQVPNERLGGVAAIEYLASHRHLARPEP